jgi:hypothetical protein
MVSIQCEIPGGYGIIILDCVTVLEYDLEYYTSMCRTSHHRGAYHLPFTFHIGTDSRSPQIGEVKCKTSVAEYPQCGQCLQAAFHETRAYLGLLPIDNATTQNRSEFKQEQPVSDIRSYCKSHDIICHTSGISR